MNSELNATLSLILSEMKNNNTQLTQINTHLGGIDSRLDNLEHHIVGIDAHLEQVDTHLEWIDTRLDKLEQKQDMQMQQLAAILNGQNILAKELYCVSRRTTKLERTLYRIKEVI